MKTKSIRPPKEQTSIKLITSITKGNYVTDYTILCLKHRLQLATDRLSPRFWKMYLHSKFLLKWDKSQQKTANEIFKRKFCKVIKMFYDGSLVCNVRNSRSRNYSTETLSNFSK